MPCAPFDSGLLSPWCLHQWSSLCLSPPRVTVFPCVTFGALESDPICQIDGTPNLDRERGVWWKTPRVRATLGGVLGHPDTRCSTMADGDDWLRWVEEEPEVCSA